MKTNVKTAWKLTTLFLLILSVSILTSCHATTQQNIPGFSKATNHTIALFLQKTNSIKGRKVAVFDADGTLVGQVPYYLADEAMYQYAMAHPHFHAKLLKQIEHDKGFKQAYNRVKYFAGFTPEQLSQLGMKTYQTQYPNKMFAPMVQLIQILKAHHFEIWIVSTSPEFMYQGFLSQQLGVSPAHIIGSKSAIVNGLITTDVREPLPALAGKVSAIQSRIKIKPLLVAGNSESDAAMLSYSESLSIVVNPAPALKTYAKLHGWLIVHIPDKVLQHIKYAAKRFHARVNATHLQTD